MKYLLVITIMGMSQPGRLTFDNLEDCMAAGRNRTIQLVLQGKQGVSYRCDPLYQQSFAPHVHYFRPIRDAQGRFMYYECACGERR